MNEASVFAKGVLLGFSLAAPLGPIGVLCVRRTLHGGLNAGVVSGLGTAFADAFYASVAVFGLSIVSDHTAPYETALRTTGGLFLVYLGIKAAITKPSIGGGSTPAAMASTFVGTFFFTLSNPATILSFGVLFAAFGFASTVEPYAATALVCGVFVGSMAWWIVLSGSVSAIRNRVSEGMLRWINRGSGLVLCVFGIVVLAATGKVF